MAKAASATSSATRVRLKPGREKSLLRQHPWVFSGAIDQVDGTPGVGATVIIHASDGRFLAQAGYSPASQIRARVWTWDRDETIDGSFFAKRVRAALVRRGGYPIDPDTRSAARMINAEADGLPGVIVDRYAAVAVLQFLAAGAERWRAEITAAVLEHSGCSSAYERSDADVRALEGLSSRRGVLQGDEPPATIEIDEPAGGRVVTFLIDVREGHKTGGYLDQAGNRARVGALAAGAEVLNCFCYTGGFSLHALANGATKVISVDSSADSMALGQRMLLRNEFDQARAEWVDADVFAALRKKRDQGAGFDVIILDPPKFAPTAGHVERAARAYKDINMLAFKLLRPGGWLATFSCSGGVAPELFQKIVAGAAADAGVDAEIVDRFGAGPDHPVVISFPEGEYLKGLLLKKR